MKTLTTVIKIIAIVLNTLLIAFFAYCMISSIASGDLHMDEGFYMWIGMPLILTCFPLSLITIVLTFLKKTRTFACVLKLISIALNICSFAYMVCAALAQGVHAEGFFLWLILLTIYALPLLNILTIALTFRKQPLIPLFNPGLRPGVSDIAQRLENLENLRSKSLITEAEYEEKRKQILDRL